MYWLTMIVVQHLELMFHDQISQAFPLLVFMLQAIKTGGRNGLGTKLALPTSEDTGYCVNLWQCGFVTMLIA